MKRKSVKKKKSLIKKPRWQNRQQVLFTLCGMIRILVLMGKSEHILNTEVEKIGKAFYVLEDLRAELRENLCL